jgi:hypothetical protein
MGAKCTNSMNGLSEAAYDWSGDTVLSRFDKCITHGTFTAFFPQQQETRCSKAC